MIDMQHSRSAVSRWLVAVFLPFAFSALLPGSAYGQALVEIERHAWTDAVNRTTRQYNRTYTSPIRTRKAYLWMQLRGSKELLEQLRSSSDGSLPIRHEWYRYEPDEIVADIAVDLSIGKKESLQKLSYEVDASGMFHWRVWSGKEQLTPGWWRVNVVYDSGDPVICASADDPNKSCEFLIEVKN